MKQRFGFILVFFPVMLSGFTNTVTEWTIKKYKAYSLYYTKADSKNYKTYKKIIDRGIDTVQSFFGQPYKNIFAVYIHPDRHSLDSQWKKDFSLPDFKSECWMVASGFASKLDILSPKLWDTQACEHIYSNTIATQQLITHELVHVFHGQFNASPDFSDVSGIDWFVEGLATYASGQCDSTRIAEIKKGIAENKIPNSLDKFWTGKFKYGLSGSVVMFIDKTYGRKTTKELLKFNTLTQILSALNTTEPALLNEWKNFMELYTFSG